MGGDTNTIGVRGGGVVVRAGCHIFSDGAVHVFDGRVQGGGLRPHCVREACVISFVGRGIV